jgi:protein TonB
MKNQPVISKSETLEDIVFEGRNKSYGAYDLNRKHRKYLILAFFISLMGVSTAIAVPFIKAFNSIRSNTHLTRDVSIKIIDVPKNNYPPPPPPPPPILPEIEKSMVYVTPIVVEEPVIGDQFAPVENLIDVTLNPPVEIPYEPVKEAPTGIEEPPEVAVLFPQESAGFMGGGIEEFQAWVTRNITYPAMAIDNGVFGRVTVEFCVNSRGEVVDIKLLRKLDPSVDEETLRVISSSPRWTPAKQGGRPVKQRFTIPFVFQMQ